ncbi:hypothetical protein [Flavobacterium sp. DG2-3]|uniref:hypothetical protein n=1 Tax=Flavobacterium sp. DG2-3 TaxID=3068317 RepID=UPI00273D1055|nr:hypothetical protein [Flavobacterium sp. DG2-3]MDP5198311.1 hypothetical protein [Flavobacterium sp. DG2-3]
MKSFFYSLFILTALNSFAQSNVFTEATNEGGSVILENPLKTGTNSYRWTLYNMTNAYGNSLQFWNYNQDWTNYGARLIISDNGNVEIGSRRNPVAKLTLDMNSNDSNGGIKMYGYTYPGDTSYWSENQFAMQYNGVFANVIASNGDSYFNGGNVGIGTSAPREKLSVNGNIRSKEVKVEAVNWPDYVFEEDYKIKSLESLEKYIKENKHLPEVPSAKEIADNGLELGEMNKTLLKKVEELTLYLIEQNKTLAEQKDLILNQQKMLQEQQKDINELKRAK